MKLPVVIAVWLHILRSTFGAEIKSTNSQMKNLDERLEGFSKLIQDIVISMEDLKIDVAALKNTVDDHGYQLMNDTTIEERVAVLESQVSALTDDVIDLGEDVNLVEAEQLIQDEKILELQIDAEDFESSIEGLVASDVGLSLELSEVNNRVTNVNATVENLDDRVVGLTADLTSLGDTVSEIDSRVAKLEVAGTVAFQVDLDEYTTIPVDSVVIFDVVELNLGNHYDSSTGVFTVPSGGAGLYYFYVNFWSTEGENAIFDVRVNEVLRCRAESDEAVTTPADNGTPSCGFVTTLSEGDLVDVFYNAGTSDTPVVSNPYAYNTFTGFRIAPE